MDINISTGVCITFSFYAVLAAYLLFRRPPVIDIFSLAFGCAMIVSALVFDLMTVLALPGIGVLLVTGLMTKARQRWLAVPGWSGLVVLALAFALHLIPGFQNVLIFQSEGIGVSAIPYRLYANLDKGIAALIVLLFAAERVRPFAGKSFLQRDLPWITGTWVLVFGVGGWLGVPLDPKFGAITLAFIFFNLFVTCLAEEAFFRLLIQQYLWEKFPFRKYAPAAGIIVSSVLFLLAHFHTGEGAVMRMALIFLAGLGYALVYWRSRMLTSAVLAHFTVNVIHFSLFAYPATFV